MKLQQLLTFNMLIFSQKPCMYLTHQRTKFNNQIDPNSQMIPIKTRTTDTQ